MKQKKVKLIIAKFGGTSVGTGKRIEDVAKIILSLQEKYQTITVVSAAAGVTNLLVEAAHNAALKDKKNLDTNLQNLHKIQNKFIADLHLEKIDKEELQKIVNHTLLHVESLLYSIYELGEMTERSMDLISSFGERFTIHFLAFALKHLGLSSIALEANNLIVTTNEFGNAQPLFTESAQKMKPVLKKYINKSIIPVITGFMGATEEGVLTTLGRGGSDFSATIIGHSMDADEVWIWTDVNGAMTADPRIVDNAQTIPVLSYAEAAELSYFGAKVLHPLTIVPAEMKKIPIWIKNTFNPNFTGTKISSATAQNTHKIKAISTMNNLCLVTLQGKGMIGVPGTAAKIFAPIAQQNINVLFISQSSSEHNISFVVKKSEGKKTVSVLMEAFRTELLDKRIDMIAVKENLAIVAIVGAGMEGYPGVAGKVFSALGEKNINVVAIAQGSSELNISFIIKEADVEKAVKSIHKAFALEKKYHEK